MLNVVMLLMPSADSDILSLAFRSVFETPWALLETIGAIITRVSNLPDTSPFCLWFAVVRFGDPSMLLTALSYHARYLSILQYLTGASELIHLGKHSCAQ